MASLLEGVITFIGVMLVLSLAAQSLQEVIKIMFAVKGQARRQALEGLIAEATRAAGLRPGDSENLVADVVGRIRGLGQKGVRPGAIRLDSLTADELGTLIETVLPDTLPSLTSLAPDAAQDLLGQVAARAKTLFGVAMEPVEDRYGRRMRGLAVACAAVVVVGLNVDARYVFQEARLDPAYRAAIGATLPEAQVIAQRRKAREDSIVAHPDLPDSVIARLRQEAQADRDSVAAILGKLQTGAFTIGSPEPRKWASLGWWVGILISVLLVSQGAPFWNDLLGTVLGLKNRLQPAPSGPGGAPPVPAAGPPPPPPATPTPPAPASAAPLPPAAPTSPAGAALTPPAPAAPAAPTVPAAGAPTPPSGVAPAPPAAPKPPGT